MTIQIGDQAPDFDLLTHLGQRLVLSDAWRDSPVILVFFPFAFSGRCQGELCELRDNIGMFAESGVRLIGISTDPQHSLRAWADQQGYPFDLVSDFWPHGEVAQSYGVFLPDRGMATRASFLIDELGVVRWSIVTDPATSRPLDGYREALAALSA